jgi:hypothetical protein
VPLELEERSPFAEDTAAHKVARSLGFDLVRKFRGIDVYDPAALKAAGFTISKPSPDYARIAQALDAGTAVPGARFRGTEYVLRPLGGAREAA